MEKTAIEWAHSTFSPWIGCTKISPGCANCYAKTQQEDKYHRVRWGKGMPRSRTSAIYWNDPIKWNKKAHAYHTRYRVFPSLCDPFDPEVPDILRDEFFGLIEKTRFLDWLLLTKQVDYAAEYLAKVPGWPWPNVWLGASMENQEWYEKRKKILEIPAKLHFASMEPLLGAISFGLKNVVGKFFDWIIVGGESGVGHRLMDPEWASDIFHQSNALGIPFFMKQDSGPVQGLKGQIPDWLWEQKNFPKVGV